MLPMVIINYYDTALNMCLLSFGTIIDVYKFSQIIIYYGLIPLLLITFGLLTIVNVRQQSNRVASIIASNRNRHREGQLARMLFLQVTIHFILSLPYGISYIMTSIFPST
jgi:hypothetical protein